MAKLRDAPISEAATQKGMVITRAGDGVPHQTHKQRATQDAGFVPNPAVERGIKRFHAASGGLEPRSRGAMARTLFSNATLHVSYAWFRSGYPLPLHSHDVDCYYLVIAGSMRLGTEEIGQGDGVFLPAATPYTIEPGAEGVEFLEMRTSPDYDTHYRGKTDTYWDRIVETIQDRSKVWGSEPAPYGLLGTTI